MPKNLNLKILTIVGARPQFIKSSTISRLLNLKKYKGIQEVIVHTGQHYDDYMSGMFFRELEIPAPNYNLHVGSGSHAQQTSLMMTKLESVVKDEKPDLILVYGDTNSTLAGTLVAAKTPCKLAHVEAGLRSFRKDLPEEVNRVVTDSLSDFAFCPTSTAINNLVKEGRGEKAILVGDVMYDSFLFFTNKLNSYKTLNDFGLLRDKYILATIHRAENTDNPTYLNNIFSSLKNISTNTHIILPLHPRTKKMVEKFNISLEGIDIIDPVSYKTMISLLSNASLVITDSGGLQKESYFAKVPCITIRDETEWIETLENGWNRLVPPNDCNTIKNTIERLLQLDFTDKTYLESYGNGNAASKILDTLINLS
jgi:UDP-GlcNAc3NAcA epimerase